MVLKTRFYTNIQQNVTSEYGKYVILGNCPKHLTELITELFT